MGYLPSSYLGTYNFLDLYSNSIIDLQLVQFFFVKLKVIDVYIYYDDKLSI